MGDTKYEELILEAIDQLRKRKARPDLDRICHMLERRHGLKGSEVNEELARLVNDGIVIKVDYKGNTSYRNAAKWVRTKSQFFGSFFNSSDISSAVLEAVEVLSLPNTDSETRSATIQNIEKYLLKRDSQSNLNIATLRAVLEKEVASGNIKQLPSGEFVTKRNCIAESTKESSSDESKKTRLLNSKKRLKTSHCSSSSEVSNATSGAEITQDSYCDYCLLTANANRKGSPEELLVCKNCNAKAHPSCMDYTSDIINRPQVSPWQCTDCKTCAVCEEPIDGDTMLFCDVCDKGYHMNCHMPSVVIKPIGKWVCSYCSTEGSKTCIETKNLTTSGVSDVIYPEICDKFKGKKVTIVLQECVKQYPDVIPLAEKWSINEVEAFFRYIGYHDEAPAFKEQEIDGQSLLLMKRSDVLTGLSIKLGPALKIYSHIKKLQSRLPK